MWGTFNIDMRVLTEASEFLARCAGRSFRGSVKIDREEALSEEEAVLQREEINLMTKSHNVFGVRRSSPDEWNLFWDPEERTMKLSSGGYFNGRSWKRVNVRRTPGGRVISLSTEEGMRNLNDYCEKLVAERKLLLEEPIYFMGFPQRVKLAVKLAKVRRSETPPK